MNRSCCLCESQTTNRRCLIQRRRKAIVGAHKVRRPPGTVVSAVGDRAAAVELIAYGPAGLIREACIEPDELEVARSAGPVVWLNVTGVHDGDLLQRIGRLVDIHPLLLEDVQNTGHRPKIQEIDGALFSTLKMVRHDASADAIDVEQVSIFMRGTVVITFQERPGDVFEELRDRIRSARGRIVAHGADYLLYALHDAVIDAAFPVVENLQERIETLEQRIVRGMREDNVAERIQHLREQVSLMRRCFWPLREVLHLATRGEVAAVGPSLVPFWQDAAEHVATVVEAIDSQRDQTTALWPLHAAVLGTAMNQIMKTLTIIATIFIPLTFVVGVYGMNFHRMPELEWSFGYPLVMGGMTAIALGMVWWFRRKGWLDRR